MITMSMKKQLSVLLVLFLTFTVFAGCLEDDSSDDEGDETDPAPLSAVFTSPRNGAMVEGIVNVKVNTQDGNTIIFFIKNEKVQESLSDSFTWDTTTYLNGDYRLKVEVFTEESSAAEDIKVTVWNTENQAPEIYLSDEIEDLELVSGTVEITLEVGDVENDPLIISMSRDGEDLRVMDTGFEGELWSHQLDTTLMDDGEHNFVFTTRDWEKESEPVEITFTVDNTAPVIDLDGISGLVAGEAVLEADVQDSSFAPAVSFYLDGEFLKNGSSRSITLDTSRYMDGEHTLTVGAVDALLNYGEAEKDITIDNQRPEVFLSNVHDGEILRDEVEVEAGWNDLSPVDYIAFYLAGSMEPVQEGDDTSWDLSPVYWLDQGTIVEGQEFELRALARDAVGNEGDYEIMLVVDLTEPNLEVLHPVAEQVLAGEQDIELRASDDETNVMFVQFEIDGELAEETSTNVYGVYTHQWDTTAVDDGDYPLKLTVVDGAENTVSQEFTVGVDNTRPYINMGGVGKDEPVSGTREITFTSSDNRGIDTVTLLVDDEEVEVRDGEGATELDDSFFLDTTLYPDGDNYFVKTIVRDFAGNEHLSGNFITIDNTDPEIRSHSPRDGAKVKGDLEMSMDARDDNGIERYYFYEGGELLYSGGSDHYSLDTTGYDDGELELGFEVEDKAGNMAEKTITVTVDNVNPLSLTILSPTNGQYLRNTVDVETEAEDTEGEIEYISFYIDDVNRQNDTSEDFQWQTRLFSNDWHELRVVCGDDQGYFAEEIIDVFIDNVDPWVDIESPEDGALLRGLVDITTDADDGESGIDTYAFYINDDLQKNSSASSYRWNTSAFDDDDYELEVIVYDRAGNRNSEKLSVTVDNTPPEIELIKPEKEYLSGEQPVRVSASDEGSGIDYIEFKIKDETRQKGDKDRYLWDTRQEDDGPEYNIEVIAMDKAGNRANVTKTVLVDNTPPEPDFTSPHDGDAVKGTHLITAAITETGSGRDYTLFYIDGAEVRNSTSTTHSWDTTAYSDDWHELKVVVFDKAGNQGETEIDARVDNAPPTVTITDPDDQDKIIGSVTVRTNAADNDGGSGLERAEFFLGGNFLSKDDVSPFTATINENDHSDGEYDLLVIVWDNAGNTAQDEITVFIGDEASPIVANPYTNFLTPYAGLTGAERLQFDDHRAVPVVSSLINNQGVTPSVVWDGSQNTKQTAEISFSNYALFSGRIALNYWTDPDKSVVVEDYAHALLMAPYASMKNYPIFIYEKQYTDEAIWKMGTVYANEIVTCGNTGYNNKGVTVVSEDDVLQFTINAAKTEGVDLEYLSVVNPNDIPSSANTGYLSSYGAAFANIHNGAVITTRANTNEINTKIHDADTLFAQNGMTLRHICIVGDHISVPMINQGGTPSDNSYADFDGDRYTIERSIGRIFALEIQDISHYFDRVANYQDYWTLQPVPVGVRGSPYMLPEFWNDNALIYCGVAAEFAEDSENHCREYMRVLGQFNTQDDSDKAHGAGAGPAIMQDFTLANFIIIDADHGYPAGTVTWDNGDIQPLHPGISFAVSCSLGRVDGQNKGNTVTYRILEQGINVYLAPTRTAYGMLVQTYPYQPAAAPGLCYLYLRYLIDNDYDSGVAYMEAKNDLINNGYAGNTDQVTTWQYQHYGDPAFNPYEPVHEGLP